MKNKEGGLYFIGEGLFFNEEERDFMEEVIKKKDVNNH